MRKLRVFVVEDDPFYQLFLKELIESNYPADVYVFGNGGDALRKIKLKPHVIFVDYHLSDDKSRFNGLELINLLNDAELPIRKILLTGSELDIENKKGFEFLEKSETSVQEVMEKLHESLVLEDMAEDSNSKFRKVMAVSAVFITALVGMLMLAIK